MTPARTVSTADLLGNTGVRRLAGRTLNDSPNPVTRHTLLRWRSKHGFPEPIARPDGFELWSAPEVRVWLAERQRSG